MGFKPLPAAIAVALGLIIGFIIPVPEGVTPNAWHLLALFVGTIAAIIGKAMPIGALSIVAIALVALALMPLIIYLLHPPEIKSTPNALQFAREKLKELGPIRAVARSPCLACLWCCWCCGRAFRPSSLAPARC